ncbi:MAG: ABC transporter substrate-binding protein [Deltaproteobacteria bacterium]|nr:ABC transporter substrate-binding protein [Deltaproteobacteria bacterium]
MNSAFVWCRGDRPVALLFIAMKILIRTLVLFFFATLTSAGAQQKVRLNWGAISGVMSPIWVAREEGLFKKHGLDLELIHIASTSKAIQSMLAGEIQFTTADALNSIQAVAAGADVVMVCEGVNRFVFSIMARPEIKRAVDLRGKKIGITRIGSSTHTAVLHVVNKAGLGPNDYTLLQLGEVPNILTTLLAGQIDAGALSPPTNSRAKKSGLHELVNLGVDGPEYPSTVIASTRAYVKANPDNTRRMVRALGEGLHIFKTNRQIGMKSIQKYARLKEADIVEDTYNQFRDAFDSLPYVSRSGIASLIAGLGEKDTKIRQLKFEDVADMRFVTEVEKEGFFKKLK